MKLSKREAVLISVLLIVAIFFLEYQLVYTPQKAKYDSLVAEDKKVQTEVDRINRLIISIPKLTVDKNNVLSEISNVSQPFFGELNQDALLWANYDALIKNGLVIKSITNSELDAAQIKIPNINLKTLSYGLQSLANDYNKAASLVDTPASKPTPTPTPTPASNKNTTNVNKEGIEIYKVQVNATGTYDQIRQFISVIEGLKKTISVTTLDLASSGVNNQVDAVIMISFFGTKKLVPSTDSINQWSQPNYQGGTGNPFVVAGVSVSPTPVIKR